MQLRVIQKVLGLLLMVFSTTLIPPLAVSIYYNDGATISFIDAFFLTLATGLALFWPVRKEMAQLRLRDGFLVVVLIWSVLGIFGALPLYMHNPLNLSVTSAIFESLSGLTTTGATVIVGLDALPQSILYYRQQEQWLGGMGLIVLAVAILPMLGIGGMQLYKAETPGPKKDKLTPRVAETAKALWYIYLTLTFVCMLAYWAAGMSLFDAIGHSFSTVAIGGFSTHDASLGFFNSRLIEMIAVVFMLVSGVNFALHFLAVRSLSVMPYARDSEFKAYALVLFLVTVITSTYLYLTHTEGFSDAFYDGIFHAVSIGTTTGFTTREYFNWPGFLPVMLLFASFIGGCAGSTGGGMKVIRVLLLFKQGMRELTRLIHPKAKILVKIGNQPMQDSVIDAVWGFFATYVALFAVMLLMMMAAGLDQITAFSAVAACLNNLGPGLGQVGANYASLGDGPLAILCIAMLLGRLEIFTFLVLFTPAFWKK
ncbi:MAG: TrkH family potassium uptake protein [Gammaproteobacteria bacterium]|nr:TrkH family potassium uptake protein [Gammaproteobacteria bacterium]